MDEARAARIELTRIERGAASRAEDFVAREEPLEIRVEGRSIAVTMRTPGHDTELAAGFLVSEGVLRNASDVAAIRPNPRNTQGNSIDVFLHPGVRVDLAQLTRHVFATSSCGLCGKASIQAVRQRFTPIRRDGIRVTTGVLLRLAASMRSGQAAFDLTGGLTLTPLDAMLRILIALFATPALLCRTGCKSRMIAHALLLQLREAEALARTLLLRDAQAIAATLPAPSKRTRKRQAETREPPLFTADYRAWRVAFRFAAPKPSRHEGKRPRHANVAEHAFLRMLAPYDPSAPPPDDFDPPPRRFNARATAARYEALRRVIENPAPFAKRLAQRLRARERRKGVTRQ